MKTRGEFISDRISRMRQCEMEPRAEPRHGLLMAPGTPWIINVQQPGCEVLLTLGVQHAHLNSLDDTDVLGSGRSGRRCGTR